MIHETRRHERNYVFQIEGSLSGEKYHQKYGFVIIDEATIKLLKFLSNKPSVGLAKVISYRVYSNQRNYFLASNQSKSLDPTLAYDMT